MELERDRTVGYVQFNDLLSLLTAVEESLKLWLNTGQAAELEVLDASRAPDWDVQGTGGVTLLLWSPGRKSLSFIYTCSYRSLFSGCVFESDQRMRKFYEELHRWVHQGKLKELFRLYFSGTADAELGVALSEIESSLSSLGREGNTLLGNLDLMDREPTVAELLLDDLSAFADEQTFVGLANRIRENVIRARLCMFCKIMGNLVGGAEDV